jgi:hypothetical protein
LRHSEFSSSPKEFSKLGIRIVRIALSPYHQIPTDKPLNRSQASSFHYTHVFPCLRSILRSSITTIGGRKSKLSCKRLVTSLSPGKSHFWHGTCAGGGTQVRRQIRFQEEHANWNCYWLPRSSLFKYGWTWIVKRLFLHCIFNVAVKYVGSTSSPTLLTSEQRACIVAAHTMQSARNLSQSSLLLYLTLCLAVDFTISMPG